jgi:hypothetical protein
MLKQTIFFVIGLGVVMVGIAWYVLDCGDRAYKNKRKRHIA